MFSPAILGGTGSARALWTVLLALVVFGLLAEPAHAGRPSRKEKKAAAHHVRAGARHLKAGRTDDAIEELKVAYGLAQDPAVLKQIGDAYYKKQDVEQAAYYYETFLAEAKQGGSARSAVEARLLEIQGDDDSEEPGADPASEPETEVDTETEPAAPAAVSVPRAAPVSGSGAVSAPTPVAKPSLAPPSVPTQRGTSRPGAGKRVAGLVIMGAGVLLVAGGAYYAKIAGDASDELSELYDRGGTFSPHHAALYDDGKSAETLSVVLLAAGSSAVVGGGILYWLGARERSRQVTVAVTPVPGHFAASVRCLF